MTREEYLKRLCGTAKVLAKKITALGTERAFWLGDNFEGCSNPNCGEIRYMGFCPRCNDFSQCTRPECKSSKIGNVYFKKQIMAIVNGVGPTHGACPKCGFRLVMEEISRLKRGLAPTFDYM